MKRLLAVTAALALCASAFADVEKVIEMQAQPLGDGGGIAAIPVYSNTSATIFSTGSTPRAHLLDDGSFTVGPYGGTGGVADGANHGFVVNTVTSSFDMEVRYYDTMNSGATPVNSVFLGGYILRFNNLAPGGYVTGLFDFTDLGLSDIAFPDDNWGIELSFYNQGTTTYHTNVTGAFSGDGTEVGSSQDVYWRDANGNGVFSSDEARTFGGGTLLANFYLQLTPEPASMGLLGLGALALIRRRR